ncbi:hypothetical protein NG99_19095 [Erwinia typographi]|uniref:Uncharacterized protein n=1 Tax=Erwinia typographi TaxID=371042 RepID=A0A0A3YRL6_9GAMM|nr:YrhA family protein [Erwinia typographi]KGT89442.1 hypothetical protein NG99_19095 [Erwinia typographi]
MTNLEKAVCEFNCISKSMGYEITPPYTGEFIQYDFGRGIEHGQSDFWHQYYAFVSISNGLFADGHTFYGVNDSGDPETGKLIEFNQALEVMGLEDESMMGRIVIGGNNTDTFYYDTRSGKWESCDRIGTNNIWESCDTLAQLIETQNNMLKDSQ